VSGKPFAEFSRERIFEPLGMTRTSWRDDHTRVVKGRAIAYSATAGGFHIDMPFENVHGNGGLLTTAGDLLKWNENFVTPRIGDDAFVKLQQTPGVFNDGTPHTYAMGLVVAPYRGVAEVGHSGSTAGYRAHLTRFPEQHLSVAVLCNVTSGAATQYARTVAEMYLADTLQPASTNTGGRGRAAPRATQDPPDRSRPVGPLPIGRFYSDEAEVVFEIEPGTEALILKRRPDVRTVLRSVGEDEYAFGGNRLKFIRDGKGEVTELSVRGSRVFDLRFKRVD
jgi:CubicO group peptidase (beta-lactamase class C family)